MSEPTINSEESTEGTQAEESQENASGLGSTPQADAPGETGAVEATAPDDTAEEGPLLEDSGTDEALQAEADESPGHSDESALPGEPPLDAVALSGLDANFAEVSPGEEAEPIGAQAVQTEQPALPSAGDPDKNWYILQTYSGFEQRVEKTINEMLKIHKLEYLVEEIFVPGEDVTRVKNGRKRKVHVIYYPGYVLIRMKLTDQLWHILMDIPRVSGFVGGTNKEPQPIKDEELVDIRSQMTEGIRQTVLKDEFELGQQVVVIDGPFANFSGKIDEVNHDKNKLRVMISILGRSTPVELAFDKVKAQEAE